MKLNHSHQRISLFSKIIKDQTPTPIKVEDSVEKKKIDCIVNTLISDSDDEGEVV